MTSRFSGEIRFYELLQARGSPMSRVSQEKRPDSQVRSLAQEAGGYSKLKELVDVLAE